jgi:hypothetical protein
MTEFDSLRRNDARHMDQLADRICASLGQSPRRIPSRTLLAVERVSRPVSVIAGMVAVVLFVVASLTLNTTPAMETSIIASAMNGDLPRAEDVYAWSRTIGSGSGR